ncbi:L-seryl-tRNA(Sec) kinase [Pseudonaja textilis]|uniref:Phosphoseryl-tRNA kinase n=1 Tax=Pseudonaja textilis TaxID=8673 RepID=A0A670Z219_PSETE|nr:L-seryl-tRNA(Sec) kinase [Pseudonaja textilis]XP_026560708.1 L-seryl-tRNA(Sec) kinase [Pseudonaja textilis]
MEQERVGGHQLGLCVLCGLPAAGKTRTAQALSSSLRKCKGWSCILLSYDDLIPLEAFGETEISHWRSYRHELLLYLEHFLQALIKGQHYVPPSNRTETMWKSFSSCLIEQGLISAGTEDSAFCQYLIDFIPLRPIYFILDDNFYYRSMRYEVYQLARQYSLGFCQLFLDSQVEVCLERNSQRKEPLPEETIFAMAQKLECPNPKKYTWEENSLTLKSAEFSFEDNLQVFNLLSSALENPVKSMEENAEEKEMDRAICASNVLHQADQALRRTISETMRKAKAKGLTPSEMKILSEELNKQKVEFLEKIKQKTNKENKFYVENSPFNITSVFSQETDDIVKKYLNKH